MNKYEVYMRKMYSNEPFSYIRTVEGIKNLREQYNDIYYSKTIGRWWKLDYDKKIEYMFLKTT